MNRHTARPTVLTDIDAVRARVSTARGAGETVALVPTMGALHDGHLAHVRRARERAGLVVVSIFVNPLQFGENEDLDRYPRTLDADLDALAPLGADAVFAPSPEQMYPAGAPETVVAAGTVGDTFEGAERPGHFDGVLTVVSKLLHIVEPDVATFGRKDAQQLALVRRMVTDLSFRTRIEPIDTVREDDGLAMSSRNQFLRPDERHAAAVIPAALAAAREEAPSGADSALMAARAALATEVLVTPDYVALVDPERFTPVADDHTGEALAILAARVGGVRLLDNALLTLG